MHATPTKAPLFRIMNTSSIWILMPRGLSFEWQWCKVMRTATLLFYKQTYMYNVVGPPSATIASIAILSCSHPPYGGPATHPFPSSSSRNCSKCNKSLTGPSEGRGQALHMKSGNLARKVNIYRKNFYCQQKMPLPALLDTAYIYYCRIL